MSKVQKWDFKAHKYNEYELPEGCFIYTNNMKDIVSCAECGCKIEFGECFTSLAIHNSYGIGYPVCSKCYEKEKKLKYDKKEVL